MADSQLDAPAIPLLEAVSAYRKILDPSQRREFDKMRAEGPPETEAVLELTLSLETVINRMKRRKGKDGGNLGKFVHGAQEFVGIVDQFSSLLSLAKVASQVWAVVKITITALSHWVDYFHIMGVIFDTLGQVYPRLADYQSLYPDSERVQRGLCVFHSTVVKFCQHVVEVARWNKGKQAYKAFQSAGKKEFQPDMDAVKNSAAEFNEAVAFLRAQTEGLQHEMQAIERKAVAESRAQLDAFVSDQSLNRTMKGRQKIVRALSIYDHWEPYRRSREDITPGTTDWLFTCYGYIQWVEKNLDSVLLCSGNLGSGKTVLTASLIERLRHRHQNHKNVVVAYFFVNGDDTKSWKAETILKSLLGQVIDAITDGNAASLVADLSGYPSLTMEQTVDLLRKQCEKLGRLYLIVDGIDHCQQHERGQLLQVFRTLIIVQYNIKIFIAGRNSAVEEAEKTLGFSEVVSTASAPVRNAVRKYVQATVTSCSDDRKLEVTDPSLANELKDTLDCRSDGLYLWVTSQINELCQTTCDREIKEVLTRVPGRLAKVYAQALKNITTRGYEDLARKVFLWVAVAKRPLTLDELLEVTHLEIGERSLKAECLVNRADRIPCWCGDLVVVDKTNGEVTFAHHNFRDFLVGEATKTMAGPFHVDVVAANHLVGEICVTYLNFEIFKPYFTHLLDRRDGSTSYERLRPVVVTSRGKQLAKHAFLDYASANWLAHTQGFEQGRSQSFGEWRRIVTVGYDNAERPWGGGRFSEVGDAIAHWAYGNRHPALMRLALKDSNVTYAKRALMLADSARYSELGMFQILKKGDYSSKDINEVFLAAAEGGHPDIIRMLLRDGDGGDGSIGPIAFDHGASALRAASRHGNLTLLDGLLRKGARLDTPSYQSATPLQIAAWQGHPRVVERLVAEGAGLGAQNDSGTPLHQAALWGHIEVAMMLLDAGADVNARDKRGNTPLHNAARGGHTAHAENQPVGDHDEVHRGAPSSWESPHSDPDFLGDNQGDPAEVGEDELAELGEGPKGGSVYIPARSRQARIVDALIAAGADIHASNNDGRTALQEASYRSVVESSPRS